MRRDPWQILGVEKSASQSEIKAAYRSLARSFHPDSDESEEAKAKWLEVSWAWDILSNGKEVPIYAYKAKLEHTFVSLFAKPQRVRVLVPGDMPASSELKFPFKGADRTVILDQASGPGDVLSADIDDDQMFIFLEKIK